MLNFGYLGHSECVKRMWHCGLETDFASSFPGVAFEQLADICCFISRFAVQKCSAKAHQIWMKLLMLSHSSNPEWFFEIGKPKETIYFQ